MPLPTESNANRFILNNSIFVSTVMVIPKMQTKERSSLKLNKSLYDKN